MLREEEDPRFPRVEGKIVLRGGRTLGFAEYGAPNGAAVLWFHGTPGGRRQIPPLAIRAANDRGIRLIGLERPGIGLSTPHLYNSVQEWADDVQQVVDRLGIDRFALVGLSGGGPYVLACAHRLRERVVAGALLGGVAPTCGPDAVSGGGMTMARALSPFLEVMRGPFSWLAWAALVPLRPFASWAFDLFVRTMPEGDRVVMRRPEMKNMFVSDLLGASRRQLRAPVYDGVLLGKQWGFALGDVRVPIRLWHGDSDSFVPLAAAHHMANRLPDSELKIRPREGHMGSLDAAEEIFDSLLALWQRATSTA